MITSRKGVITRGKSVIRSSKTVIGSRKSAISSRKSVISSRKWIWPIGKGHGMPKQMSLPISTPNNQHIPIKTDLSGAPRKRNLAAKH